LHEWKRVAGHGFEEPEYEYATTETLTPPPGEGWVLTSKFGVGKVKGAGNSPARSS